MKKYSLILALLMALVLGFVGCGGGGGGGGGGETDMTIVLGHNFQYGHGYQTGVVGGTAHIDLLDYFDGKVSKDDEFVISFKVKADRDLEDQLAFGFVDPTEAASYWTKLTDVLAIGPKGAEGASTIGTPTAPAGGWLKADVEITIDLEVTAIANALGGGKANNKLYFQSSGQCTAAGCATTCDWSKEATTDFGDDEGGLKGPITLTITDFSLTRKGEAAPPCCEDAACEEGCADCAADKCGVDGDVCGTDCCLPIPTFVLDDYDDTTLFTVADATVVTLCAPTSINTTSGAPIWELDGDTDTDFADLVGGTQLLIKLGDITAAKIGYFQLAVQCLYTGSDGYEGWEQHNVLSGGSPFPEITSGGAATWDADSKTITITLNAATVAWLAVGGEFESGKPVTGIKFAGNAGGAQNFEIIAVGVVIPD